MNHSRNEVMCKLRDKSFAQELFNGKFYVKYATKESYHPYNMHRICNYVTKHGRLPDGCHTVEQTLRLTAEESKVHMELAPAVYCRFKNDIQELTSIVMADNKLCNRFETMLQQ